jgi:prepilin-type N-terminal cleavage/methylation domain-containing protein
MICLNPQLLKARLRKGYTLVEVLVASAILGLAMGAAGSLAGTMNIQEEVARVNAVGTNYADNAAALWQLGQSEASIQALTPTVTDNPDLSDAIVPPASGQQVSFTSAGTYTLANSMGTVDKILINVTIKNPTTTTNRVHTVQPYFPQIR